MRNEVEYYKKCKVELMNYSVVQLSAVYTFSNLCFVLFIIAFLPMPYVRKEGARRGNTLNLRSISYSLKSDKSSASQD